MSRSLRSASWSLTSFCSRAQLITRSGKSIAHRIDGILLLGDAAALLFGEFMALF